MQKHMLQLGVVLIVALITTGIGVWGPLATAWRGGRSRCPNRACRLLATLVIVLCVSAVAQAAAPCPVPSKTYPTIQAAVDRATCTTITVASGTYPELITVARDVTIRGAGQDSTVVSGGDSGPVVTIASGTVTIRSVTIQNGRRFNIDGRGIVNRGTLTVQNSTVSGNVPMCCEDGGGIYNEGTLTVQNSTVSSNGAFIGGGIYNEGTLTVQNSTVADNGGEIGGGIVNGGTLTVQSSTVSGNRAYNSGAGIYNENRGTLTVKNSTVADNRALFGAGGIVNAGTLTVENSTISGNEGGASGGGISNDGTVTVENSTISDNSAYWGGGIWNAGTLTVENSTVAANSASDGGGIFNSGGGTVTLTDVTFENNIPNDCTGCPGLL